MEGKKEHTDESTNMRGYIQEHKCESAQMRAADAEALVVVKVPLTVVVEPTTSKTASSLKFKTLQEHLHIEIHEHK